MQSQSVPLDAIAFKLLATMCHKTNDAAAAKNIVSALLLSEVVVDNADCQNLMVTLSNGRNYKEILSILDYMNKNNIQPDVRNYTICLKACANLRDLTTGKQIHFHIVKHKVAQNSFIQSSLLSLYAKCGDLDSATSIFTCMTQILTTKLFSTATGRTN
jgi:hypothetical protein